MNVSYHCDIWIKKKLTIVLVLKSQRLQTPESNRTASKNKQHGYNLVIKRQFLNGRQRHDASDARRHRDVASATHE